MDRRLFALCALVAFAVATAAAIVISGARPAAGQGIAPVVVQGAGYVCAILAAVDLLAPAAHPAGADRLLGGVVLAAVGVLVLLGVFAFAEPGRAGAGIGAGFLRLVCLVVIVAVAARLIATTRLPGRRRP